jgi:hypothetical protein
MITTTSHTNAVTPRPADAGSETLPIHTLARERDQAVVRRRIGSFADGRTAQWDSAERTVGSFATGMAKHPERSRAWTGSFADGLTAVSHRFRVRIGSFAEGMTALWSGDGVARDPDFAPGVSPAWDGSDDARDSANSAAQNAVAA